MSQPVRTFIRHLLEDPNTRDFVLQVVSAFFGVNLSLLMRAAKGAAVSDEERLKMLKESVTQV